MAILGTAMLATSLCGCQSAWRGTAAADSLADAAADGPPAPPLDQSRPDATPAAAPAQAATATPGDPNAPAAGAAAVAAGSAALADDRWVQAVPTPDGQPSKYRWRHFGLEGFLARGSWQAELTAALADKQPIVATNAAIVLARGGSADDAVVQRLAGSIDDVTLRMPLRYAAVEALACVPVETARDALSRAIDREEKFLKETPSAYTPDMHAELLRGLIASPAPRKPAEDERQLTAALASGAFEVRRVALSAWLDPERKNLPKLALELRRDPEPRVRAVALQVLAVQRPAPAETLLLSALDDTNLTVRIAAIGALGKLGTPACRTTLEKLRTHSHEAARVAAVESLAHLAGCQAVLVSAKDKSWRVRQAVADSLSLAGRDRQPIAADVVEMAQTLVHDPSLEVQRSLLKSLADWPLETSGGVLLTAMAEGGYQTRKDAAKLLAARWQPGADFPVEAPPAERTPAVAVLRQRWRAEFPDPSAPAGPDPAAEAQLSAERAARLRQLLLVAGDGRTAPSVRQQAADTLVGFGPSLITMLEGLPPADAANLPEALFQEVLPKIHPVFVALDRLSSTDVRVRRDGATNLTTALAGKPLPGLALDRLVTLGRREDDPVVWQALLQITAQDARQGAEQLAYLAVGNASSDVRRRACDYLAAHPDRRHIPVLMPMLGDASSTVAIAAVRGLGAIGTLDDPRPLVDLLLTTDRPLRLEVAVNLVKLKVDQGRRGLGADGARSRHATAARRRPADGRAGRSGLRADAAGAGRAAERRRPGRAGKPGEIDRARFLARCGRLAAAARHAGQPVASLVSASATGRRGRSAQRAGRRCDSRHVHRTGGQIRADAVWRPVTLTRSASEGISS